MTAGYRDELTENPDGWRPIAEASRRGTVTLLYSAHDTEHNGALVLRDFLAKRAGTRGSAPRQDRRGPVSPA